MKTSKNSKKVKRNNVNNIKKAASNINSLVSKFDELTVIGQVVFDILIISKAKLDAPFPVVQCWINGFPTQYRLDQNQNGGGIVIFVWEDITWNKSFLLTMKHYFLELIFESPSGYFVDYIIHLLNLKSSIT